MTGSPAYHFKHSSESFVPLDVMRSLVLLLTALTVCHAAGIFRQKRDVTTESDGNELDVVSPENSETLSEKESESASRQLTDSEELSEENTEAKLKRKRRAPGPPKSAQDKGKPPKKDKPKPPASKPPRSKQGKRKPQSGASKEHSKPASVKGKKPKPPPKNSAGKKASREKPSLKIDSPVVKPTVIIKFSEPVTQHTITSTASTSHLSKISTIKPETTRYHSSETPAAPPVLSCGTCNMAGVTYTVVPNSSCRTVKSDDSDAFTCPGNMRFDLGSCACDMQELFACHC